MTKAEFIQKFALAAASNSDVFKGTCSYVSIINMARIFAESLEESGAPFDATSHEEHLYHIAQQLDAIRLCLIRMMDGDDESTGSLKDIVSVLADIEDGCTKGSIAIQ